MGNNVKCLIPEKTIAAMSATAASAGLEEDEDDMISLLVNNLPVTVKRGLHAKTILAQYCHQNKLVYPTFIDALSNPTASGRYQEWRLFKSRFELGGKKVVGSGLTLKDAEQAAARKYINNNFMPGENSPLAEIPVPNLKKKATPCQRLKEKRRMEKYIEKKRREAAVAGGGEEALPNVDVLTLEEVAQEEVHLDGAIGGISVSPHDGMSVSSFSRFIFVDLERACGNLDSEIIQIGFCSANDAGLANIFPKGKIDPGCSRMSHKIVAAGNLLKRNGKILPSTTLKTAAEEFIRFLKKFQSQNGKKAVLCCHGEDMVTLFNNFALLGMDSVLGENIEGSVDFQEVLTDNDYPKSSSMSLTKIDPNRPNLAQTILKEDFDIKILSEAAHDALWDAQLLMQVVQRYCKDFVPETIILDTNLVQSDILIKTVEYHVRRSRMKKKIKSKKNEEAKGILTFNGWDQYLLSGENLPRQRKATGVQIAQPGHGD